MQKWQAGKSGSKFLKKTRENGIMRGPNSIHEFPLAYSVIL